MTRQSGFNNVLSATGSAHATSSPPLCNVESMSIEFVSYTEESDWSGPMLARYTGVINAEESCDSVEAKLLLKFSNTTYNTTDVELTKTGVYSYSFDTTIAYDNTYGEYYGKIKAYDSSNEADKSNIQTERYLYDPPCYLEVDEFTKIDQVVSLDHTSTGLTYNAIVAQHGDNACRDTSATLELYNSTGLTLRKVLDAADLDTAMSTYGINVTMASSSAAATYAKVSYSDPRAVANQTEQADGFVAPTSYDCTINVQEFCLETAE